MLIAKGRGTQSKEEETESKKNTTRQSAQEWADGHGTMTKEQTYHMNHRVVLPQGLERQTDSIRSTQDVYKQQRRHRNAAPVTRAAANGWRKTPSIEDRVRLAVLIDGAGLNSVLAFV